MVTNNGYRCFPLDKTGRLVCDRPVIASVAAADRRATDTWMDLVCDGGEEAEPLRRTVTEHWTPLGTQPPHWMRLKTELRELSARLEEADDAFDVRGDLDARRHARITEKLTLKITQTEDAIAAAEPTPRHHPVARSRLRRPTMGRARPRRSQGTAPSGLERDSPRESHPTRRRFRRGPHRLLPLHNAES